MKNVKFGIRFPMTDYAYSEIANFIECADGIEGANNLEARYIDFLREMLADKVKPSTMVDADVLKVFVDDLYNQACIDFLEGHHEEEAIVNGGRMFLTQHHKLRSKHGRLVK